MSGIAPLRRGRGRAAAGLAGAAWLLAAGCAGEPGESRAAGRAVAATPVGVVVKEAEAAPGYTLFVPLPFRNTGTAYLVDLEGRVAHDWTFPTSAHVLLARLLENGNLMVMTGLGVRELDPDGGVVWDYEAAWLHHDFLPLPNGNVLLLMLEKKTAAEVVARGGNPENVGAQDLGVDYVVEVRPTGPTAGEVVWRWSAWEHLIQDFDPGKPDYGVVAEHPERVDLNYRLAEAYRAAPAGGHADWLRVNSLDYDPLLDRIALSVRNLGELWIIDRGTTTTEAAGHSGGKAGRGGDLLYRWGNPAAWGGEGDQELWWAHNVQWIEPGLPGGGNVILFNNGAGYPGNRRHHSSVEEVALPVAAAATARNRARRVWRYAAEPPEAWYSARASGVQRLPNGNTLICSAQQGTIFEVTPVGKTVWKYVNPATSSRGRLRQGDPMPIDPRAEARWQSGREVWRNRVYRAHRYPPDHPGVQALDLTPGETVELPAAAQDGGNSR